jgi:hypothetical protein
VSVSTDANVEYTKDGPTFKPLPDMLERKFDHCMALLENGYIFVAGNED